MDLMVDKKDFYIFLDFDGVLHKVNSNHLDFFHALPIFEEGLKEISNIKIVLTTSWRVHSSLDDLTWSFPETLKSKVVGVTENYDYKKAHSRFYEILEYNKKNNISKYQWIAIDDMASLFTKNCQNLYKVDGFTGITKVDMLNIKNKISVFREVLKKEEYVDKKVKLK